MADNKNTVHLPKPKFIKSFTTKMFSIPFLEVSSEEIKDYRRRTKGIFETLTSGGNKIKKGQIK